MSSKIYVATAGWSIPRQVRTRFPAGKSNLARYAKVFPAVEINSTFYRPHRPSTFERWAASVPRGFSFSVKVPREITHDQRLEGSSKLIKDFMESLAPLGPKLGCLLVQLAPSLKFDVRVARAFFTALRKRFDGSVALEPRHQSWFGDCAHHVMVEYEVARVAADPPMGADGGSPGGWDGFAYFRLHGSPRIYYSSYEKDFLEALSDRLVALRSRRIRSWCVFDNTASGAATANALSLKKRLGAR